jgi:hypothetical protein
MSALLELLNRLLGEALDQRTAQGATQGTPARGGPVQVHSVVLDSEGARVVARLLPPAGEGELVLRLRAEPAQGERQALLLTCERGPQAWAPALEPFRHLLERARLRLELDFSEPAAAPGTPPEPPP